SGSAKSLIYGGSTDRASRRRRSRRSRICSIKNSSTPRPDTSSSHVSFTRVIVIVMDSVGIGELPDAATYGDQGSNTIGNIAKQVPLKIPTLRSLGLDRLVSISGTPSDRPRGAAGKMAEASAGKDSVTGHWEMMGIVLDRAFPTFPNGFSPDIIR